MVPARQRLGSLEPQAIGRENRLKVDIDLAVDDGAAQLRFQKAAMGFIPVHVGMEGHRAGAASGLGAIERPVGAPQQIVPGDATFLRRQKADRHADPEDLSVAQDRPADGRNDQSAGGIHIRCGGLPLNQDREFVPTQTADHRLGPAGGAQPVTHLGENGIACVMPV
ncbi:MAG: hypothetical protein FD152_966 [Xanthobacteraceae bacterium]|nr:MAG: hypothetical protein FD152_966 [Xanthobacteraceae bacterium]